MRDNNLNLLRLIAAFLVLYAHAFDFIGLVARPTFLGFTYGTLGIHLFFIISGYLIAKSWQFDPNTFRFLVKRCLRIFPALFVVIFLSALVYGPLMTTLSMKEYFRHPNFIYYFKNLYLSPVYSLPGVLENANIANAVNGSLWSLPVEFFMYLNILLIGVLFKNNRFGYVVLAVIFIGAIIFWVPKGELIIVHGMDIKHIFSYGIFFIIGALYCQFNVEQYFTLSGVVIASFLLIFCSYFSSLSIMAMWLFLPYIVLSFGLSGSWLGNQVNKIVDYSYGVYIYAFPTQQAVLYVYPDISLFVYIFTSSTITLFFAILSWHYIEAPFLSMKSKRKV